MAGLERERMVEVAQALRVAALQVVERSALVPRLGVAGMQRDEALQDPLGRGARSSSAAARVSGYVIQSRQISSCVVSAHGAEATSASRRSRASRRR